MKKILTAIALMGLSGTALRAQADMDLSSLPFDLQAKIKNAQTAAASTPNPIQQYVNQQSAIVAATQTWLAKLPAYLNQIPEAVNSINSMKGALGPTNKSLTTLTNVEPLVTSVNAQLAQVNATSEYISYNYIYPNACVSQTKVGAQQGCVMHPLGQPGQYALYAECNNENKPLATFSPDVGQFGTGTDFHVGGNLLNTMVPVLIKPYGAGGASVVVCMDTKP